MSVSINNTAKSNGPISWVGVASAVPQQAFQIDGASAHTIQVIPTGSVSYALEGSLDGQNFFSLTGTLTDSTPDMTHVVNKPVNFIRVNISAITGTANFFYLGQSCVSS